MVAGTTGRRSALLAVALVATIPSGCGEEGAIDREALGREASLPDSTAPELDGRTRDEIRVGDVHRIALNVHCGVRFLPGIDGRDWEAVETDSDFSDLELEYVGNVEGELEMVENDRLEFRHPKLRATFRPYDGDAAIGTCD